MARLPRAQRAPKLRALGALVAALTLTACATAAPVASSPAPSGPTVSPAATPTPSSSLPGPDSSAGTPMASPPAAAEVELQAKGTARARFGTAEPTVLAQLAAASGKPDESNSGPVCELNSATAYGRQVHYGGAVFLFESKANGTRKSPRTFTGWIINLEQRLKPAIKLLPGYPTKTTFAKLKSTFPEGRMSEIHLGESSVYVFRTPSGIWYRGDDDTTPRDLGAGPMGSCE